MTEGRTLSESSTAVMVLSAGGFQGLGITRLLASISGVRIVVGDSEAQPLTGLLADDTVRLPPVDDREAFLSALRTGCADLDVRLLIPATEHELLVLSEEAVALERDLPLRVAVSPPEVLRRFGDRASLSNELERIGVPHPPVLSPASLDVEDLPVLGKPRRGWGGRRHLVLRTPDDLAEFLGREPSDDLIWTPLFEDFRELSVDFAIGFSGELSEPILRERLRTTGGFCVVAAQRENEIVSRHVGRVAQILRYHGARGLFNLQFLLTASGPFLSDLNLRFGTSGVFPLGLGVNPIEILLSREIVPASAGCPKALPNRTETGRRAEIRMYRTLTETFIRDVSEDIAAILFDLDDTLIDQKAWILEKLEVCWKQMRSELPDRESFLLAGWRALEGHRQAVLIDDLIRTLNLAPGLRERLIDEYRRASPISCPVFPDVKGCLTSLRDRGLKLGLVTDNPPSSQRQKLGASGLVPLLDQVVFTRDEGEEKPSPAGVLAACERLGVETSRAVLVGDNPLTDGFAATSCGLRQFYWLRRWGGFYAVSETLVQRLAPELWAVTSPIGDLRQLAEAVRRR